MGDVLFIALRRLRTPLITLILAYAISVAGLVAMPGLDAQGQAASLSFFHAFYVVSYTATTIGFGELPFVFTDAQRAWITFTIYLSVTCWAYALGSIFALVQEAVFRTAIARSSFARRVRRLDEPFYIIAGYGQSGTALAHAFDELGTRSVLIELRPERAARPDVEIYHEPPLSLCADARWPDVLQDAGAAHPRCKALIVLVGDDEAAQAIAIGAAALAPELTIIARVHSTLARANLDSFANIAVIDPFDTFAINLEMALATPAVLWVEEWLSSVPGSACPEPPVVPQGHWLVLGYGRFGHAVARALERTGSSWTAIDSNDRLADEPHLQHSDNSVDSLHTAGIENAVGIVACTDRDAMNLALVTRARKLKPGLHVIVRQNHVAERSLIEAARAHLCFVKSEIMVRECLQLLVSPLLNRFLLQVRKHGSQLAEQIAVRLLTELEERVPHIWVFDCEPAHPGLRAVLNGETAHPLLLRELLINPVAPPETLRAVPLLLLRGETETMLPALDAKLQSGDRILFAGRGGIERLQHRFYLDPSPLEYVRSGIEPPRSWLFRTLQAHLAERRARKS
ncbi:hypothetical protein GCM10027046_38340 [Uliginosibacterium flavum]|uniref:NAD-binding protein n=1 Tax=Uliginosibacterium flavum TaxID=1396831 RepID=A0ABV2TKZ3_9RHOO